VAVEDEVASATEVDVAAVHHEDEVASAIEVDVAAPADSVVVVEEAVASQEVEVVVSLPVVAVVVVASVDVDVEVIKRDVLSSSSLCAPRETSDSRVFLVQGFSDCHDYYQPIPRSSFDGVLELRWGLCKSTNIRRHAGTV
jgi:hypothetical protein